MVHNDSWKDPELSGLRTGCWELVTGSSSGVRHHLTAKRVIRKGKSSCRDCGSFVKMRNICPKHPGDPVLAARGTGGSRDRVMKHSEVNPSAGPPALNEQEPIKLGLSQDPESLPMGDNPEPLHLGHGIPQDIAQDSTGALVTSGTTTRSSWALTGQMLRGEGRVFTGKDSGENIPGKSFLILNQHRNTTCPTPPNNCPAPR